jgi:hypothetical protein
MEYLIFKTLLGIFSILLIMLIMFIAGYYVGYEESERRK